MYKFEVLFPVVLASIVAADFNVFLTDGTGPEMSVHVFLAPLKFLQRVPWLCVSSTFFRRFFQVLLEVVLGACAVHCWRTSVNAAAREVFVSCVDACCRLRAVRALPAAPPRRSSRSSRHGCPSTWLLVMCCGGPESKSRAMFVFGQCGAAVL